MSCLPAQSIRSEGEDEGQNQRNERTAGRKAKRLQGLRKLKNRVKPKGQKVFKEAANMLLLPAFCPAHDYQHAII